MKRKKEQDPPSAPAGPADMPPPGPLESWARGVPWNILCLTVIGAWTFLIYSNTWHNELLYDDKVKILENPMIRTLAGSTHRLYRVVTNVSYYFDYSRSGDPKSNPVPFHITSIGVHIINAWLVFWLALLLLPPGMYRRWLCFMISLLYALHPFNTEAVNYLNSRQMLMVTMFMLLSCIAFIKAFPRDASAVIPWKKCLYVGLSLISVLGAVLSRESGIVVIGILLFYIFSFVIRDRKVFIQAMGITIGAGLVAAIMIITKGLVPMVSIDDQNAFTQLSHYWVTQSVVAMKYLSLALLPLPGRFNVDHDMPMVQSFDLLPSLAVAGVMLCIPAIVLLWKNHRVMSLFLFWVCICHAPTTFVPRSDYMVEYRNYAAMVGFAFLAVMALEKLVSRWEYGPKALMAGLLLLSCFYSVCVWERNKVWKSEETLWADAIKKAPNKGRVNVGVAMSYFRDVQEKIPREVQALQERFFKGKIQEPEFRAKQAELLAKKKESCLKGLALIERATQLEWNYYQGYPVGAAFCYHLDRVDDAIQWCSRVIGLIDKEGRHFAYDQVLGEAYNIRGDCQERKGQAEPALADYQKAIYYKRSFTPPYYRLVPLAIAMNRLDLARTYTDQFLAFLPNEPSVLVYSSLLTFLDRPQESRGHVQAVLKSIPKNDVRNLLGELLRRVSDMRVRNHIQLLLSMI